ncbi:hypothetical protein E2C01_086172 [Portunus trituberculatus]|uniref:Uncharacterized protein n=1 Tax=Portunus trituberculatus TaxID=210409 RepID=A0A5B7J9J5_PORTR|nr:hypothetical protein [Portunus trituberculatus]
MLQTSIKRLVNFHEVSEPCFLSLLPRHHPLDYDSVPPRHPAPFSHLYESASSSHVPTIFPGPFPFIPSSASLLIPIILTHVSTVSSTTLTSLSYLPPRRYLLHLAFLIIRPPHNPPVLRPPPGYIPLQPL